jgi:hypothetical protein
LHCSRKQGERKPARAEFCNEIKDLERTLRLIERKNTFQMNDLAEALQVKPQQETPL